ncbi:MAG TPA: hydrogenase/urease maturation nickel metallochaperone HypA [Patescibacteria group bacterium]|nr:hydrogenase/urease maturation nickel metallochaperone HypA [Patescibacteria group bacterium]
MHDLHEADRILKLVLDYAGRNNFEKVTKIVIGLGNIIEHGLNIDPDNLKFNISMLARETKASDAEIIVEKIDGGSWELKEIEGDK